MKTMLHCDKSVRVGFGWDTIHGLWRHSRPAHLLLVLHAFFCVACSVYPTPMPDGRGGVASLKQVGGKGMVTYNADGSMGFTFDNEISFQHLAQTATTVGLGYIGYLESLAEQVTSRMLAGEITKREGAAALAAIEQAKIAAGTTEATVLNPNFIPK